MVKKISLYDTTGFKVLNENFTELLGYEDLGKERIEFNDISYEKEPIEALKNSRAVIWAPFPTELIKIGVLESSLTKDNYFEIIKREGFNGKRILYLSEGFNKKHFQRGIIPCKIDFSKISDYHIFFMEEDSYKKFAEIIKNS